MTSRSKKRHKDCYFCNSNKEPDYKQVEVLKKFITDRGKIVPRSRTGLCQKHQKRLTKAIKRARHLSLLPFIVRL